jgi:hypothetical protein
MPANRGSMREETDTPDTKIPVTYIPRMGKDSSTRLSTIVIRLNLGDYDSKFHYGALAYLQNIHRYIFLYRHVNRPWTVDNFVLLKKNKEDSLDMIDSSKIIQSIMDKCQGIEPIGYTRKIKRKRKRSNKSRTLKRK